EHGQLSLHYQPKVNLATGLIDGVEALVRWHHAQHGPIPPSDFIPLAVHTGLIRPLSLWVLRTALEQSRRLHEEGLAIRVAVYQALRGMGCDVVQGYFLSRPLPPEECRRYLVEWPQRLAS
ncbi:MAG: EAL domain-containing protein, partial [Chloroflexi bacterium]|nr:EAL domain-containing protein [Chloroflexota bacterium]